MGWVCDKHGWKKTRMLLVAKPERKIGKRKIKTEMGVWYRTEHWEAEEKEMEEIDSKYIKMEQFPRKSKAHIGF